MSNKFFEGLKFAIPISLIMWALMILLVLSIFNAAHADETNPNAPTPVTEWVYQGASFADMLTTIDIAKHPKQYYEFNPILGEHPSEGRVIGYFTTTHVLHYLITRELVRENVPAPIVQTWEALGIGLEVGLVAHNYSIGLRARF
jgi:hypothetical protein